MNTIFSFESFAPRAESIHQLIADLPECIERAAAEVGIEGVKAFFNGYKQSVEEAKIAA